MNNRQIEESKPLPELERQKQYMEKVQEYLAIQKQKTGKEQTYFIFTTGCQMNAHDSEKIAGMLTAMGFVESGSEENADFVIYNTCCIRENAEEKIYGRLGRLKHYKKTNKNMKIAICGCMTQQDIVIEKLRSSYKYVDIVFGTFNLYKLPELLYTNIQTGSTLFDIWKEEKEMVEELPTLHKSAFSASVNIMYGCNNFCSYCIVPYVRGRERSRMPEDILCEIEKLVQKGVKEIMLLGQNVNSYGKNLEEPVSFAELLRKIERVQGIERIRFMTSHPKDISDDLISALAECKKIGSYLHLPFQSGSTRILKAMNRGYTKEHYLSVIEKVRKAVPDMMISTDIIVGFPGETEEDFQETLDVVEKVRFSTAFTFLYSKRTGTPAAIMEKQISESTAKARFQRLLDVLNPITAEINQAQKGRTMQVLAEGISKHNPAYLTGRTENNSLVHFKAPKECIGSILPVKITDNKTFYLLGERI